MFPSLLPRLLLVHLYQSVEFEIRLDLIQNSLHDDVHHATPAVISRAHEVHSSLLYQLASHGLLLGRIIYGNGMAAVLLHHLHAGHVGFSISEIDHSREWDGALVIRNILVHLAVVAHLTDALVDLEEKLRLRGIIHGYGWPVGDAILIIEKRAGIDVLEFLGDGGALYHLLQSRGVDVVLDLQSDACAIFVDEREPLLHATEEFHIPAEALEGFAGEGDMVFHRFIQHHVHIGEDAAGIFTHGKLPVFIPEFFLRLSCCLDESELLHVTGR